MTSVAVLTPPALAYSYLSAPSPQPSDADPELSSLRTRLIISTLLTVPVNVAANYVFMYGALGVPAFGGIGAGIGSAMAANKIRGVRAAMCNDEAAARNAREHNDANVMTLGAKVVDAAQALALVKLFVSSRCVEDRHKRRVAKIVALERS